MRLLVIVFALLLHGMAGCSKEAEHDGLVTAGTTTDAPLRAMAVLQKVNKTGVEAGTVGWANFTQTGAGVRIDLRIVGGGLTAGDHGLHVHTVGDCGGNGTVAASGAGGHFNPDGGRHGAHAGDLGNVALAAGGTADVVLLPPVVPATLTLRAGETYTIVGRSIVLHEKADDGTTDPSGNSGARIVCGVIAAA